MDVLIPLLLIVGVMVGIPVAGWFIWWRYRERRRKLWPITIATIETGAVITLLQSRPITHPPLVLLLGYCFTVNGSYYSGQTAIGASDYGDADWVVRKIKGLKFNIRYDPHDPNLSFAVDTTLGEHRLLRRSAYSGLWTL